MKILFVCLGNICRSPTAEAVMRELAKRRSVELHIESAGTGDWHIGHPRDRRMHAAASSRGYPLSGVARQVALEDYKRFDLIVAMDGNNLAELHLRRPKDATARVELLRKWDLAAKDPDVPDPYYGGPEGFAEVVDIVERCCERLLDEIQQK